MMCGAQAYCAQDDEAAKRPKKCLHDAVYLLMVLMLPSGFTTQNEGQLFEGLCIKPKRQKDRQIPSLTVRNPLYVAYLYLTYRG
jgi:hypothetical protein